LWCNPKTGHLEAVPRHTEIPDLLARKICKNLSVPQLGG
jgi:mRNA interferase HicA